MRKLRMYTICLQLKDTDIEATSQVITILTRDSIECVRQKLQTAFQRFDLSIGKASEFRYSYGWGVYGFIEYLKARYYKSWILEINETEFITFIGD